jgi:hypothetical protein
LSIVSSHAFLFDDGTFETPIPSLEDGNGWEAFGTPDLGSAISREDWANGAPGTGGETGYAASGDGQYGMVFRGFSGSAGGFYHDVPVVPGQQYDFHIQSHAATEFYFQVVVGEPNPGTVSIVFEWYDGDPASGGTLVLGEVNDITDSITEGGSDAEDPIGPSIADRWQDWDYNLTAPAGSAHLRVIVQWTAAGVVTGGDEAMRWDNAELTTALDPLNDMVESQSSLRLSVDTQEGVSYTVETSPDLAGGFSDAGLAPIMGNGATQELFFGLGGQDRGFYGLRSEQSASDGQLRVVPASPPIGDGGWEGYMNVFELPGNGGGFVFGSGWGTDDLVSNISSATDVLILSPNVINDPNEFWYQNTTGAAPDPANPGGPGQKGNKSMEANLYYTFSDSELSGTTVTFSGTVLSNTLTAAHVAEVFIKDFAPDFSTFTESRAPLTPGAFSISLATDPGAGRHLQFGFSMVGENVWSTDVAPFGNVRIAIEPFVFDDARPRLELVPATAVTWDGQLGVHYLVEYSDDGGSNWQALVSGAVVGTGESAAVAEPAGSVPGRTYRVRVAPSVPRVPGA